MYYTPYDIHSAFIPLFLLHTPATSLKRDVNELRYCARRMFSMNIKHMNTSLDMNCVERTTLILNEYNIVTKEKLFFWPISTILWIVSVGWSSLLLLKFFYLVILKTQSVAAKSNSFKLHRVFLRSFPVSGKSKLFLGTMGVLLFFNGGKEIQK